MGAVRIERIEVGGYKLPHELKISLVGHVDRFVDDDVVFVMEEYGQEFQDAVAEAFERVVLQRLWSGEYKWANRKRSVGVAAQCQAQPAQPTTIEDIEL